MSSDHAIKGFLWTASGKGLQGIAQVVSLVVFARLFTPEDFGIVTAAFIFINFSLIFSEIGVGAALVQSADLSAGKIKSAFTISVAQGLLFFLTILLLASPLSSAIGVPSAAPTIRVLSVVFLLRSVAIVPEYLLRRNLEFRKLSIIEFGSYTIGFTAVGICLGILGLGVNALALASVSQSLMRACWLSIAQPHSKAMGWSKSEVKDLLQFGGGFTIARILNYVALQADNFIVGRFLGVSALGIYDRAYQLMGTPISLVGQAVDSVLFPTAAKMRDDQDRIRVAFMRCVTGIVMTVLPVSVAVSILTPEVIRVVMGDKWMSAVPVFQILVLGMASRLADRVTAAISRALGMVYQRAALQGVYASMVIVGALIGQTYGLVGVATSTLCALWINASLMYRLTVRVTGTSWLELTKLNTRGFIVSVASGLLVYFVATLLRQMALSDGLVLLGSSLFFITIHALAVGLACRLVYGDYFVWIVTRLRSILLPQRASRLSGGAAL